MKAMFARSLSPAVVAIGLWLTALFAAAGATWYVTSDGTGSGSSWADPTNSIQGAIVAAAIGDTILVSNGHYVVTNEITITNAVLVRGLNPPDGVTITRDPAYETRLVMINALGAVLDGFTVTNGYASDSTLKTGGGIWVGAGLVTNCNIFYCKASNRGGGLDLRSTNAVVNDCRVISNEVSGSIGGGGVCFNCAATLLNSTVTDNKSAGQGAGIQIRATSGAMTVISNCVISGNQHLGSNKRGAGIIVVGVDGQRVRIQQSVISNNFNNSLVGGISVENGGVVELVGSAITHNKGTVVGGVSTHLGGSILISNCVFTCNEGTYGGGIYHGYLSGNVGSMTVTHSRIIGNLATNNDGGGVYFKTNGVMEFCEVVSNSAMRCGGGVYIAPQTQTRIRNCLFMGNTTTGDLSVWHGGGIYIDVDGTNTLESCTIVGNRTTQSGGGLALMAAASNRIFNCIVYSNSAAAGDADLHLTGNDSTNVFHFSCSPALINSENGNTTNAPLFASFDAGNYRLAQGSPCVNTGTNLPWMAETVDLDGRIRIDRFFRLVDMGCYEYLPQGMIFNLR